ncbi:M48 family metallopeptidase [Streptomyces sp. NPDC001070]
MAIVLLAGLYALLIGFGLGAVAFTVLKVGGARAGREGVTDALTSLQVVLAAVLILVVIGQVLKAISSPIPVRAEAVPVSREDAPALWEMATGVAWQAGTRPPDVLLLTADTNAAVAEDARMLGLLSGQRRLYLGLPLLAALTHAELRAILAHEFGHFTGRHTRFGALCYRISATLDTAFDRLRYGTRIVTGLHLLVRYSLRLYAAVFRRLTFAARRRQEIEADRTAARLAGREVTADALRAMHGTAGAWRRFTAEWLEPSALAGMHPDHPYLAFQYLLGDLGVRRSPVDTGPARAGRHDSHPPLGVRLDRIAKLDVPAGDDDGTGALRLLPRDTAKVMEQLRGSASQVTTIPWERWIELSANRAAGTRAWELLRAASRVTGRRDPGLDTVLRLLADNGLVRLAGEFDGTREELADALHALVGHTLLREGRASWRPLWGGGTRLECEGLTDEGLRVLIAEALSQPPELDRLRLHLTLLDVNPDRSGPPDPANPWTEEDEVTEPSFQGWHFTTVADHTAEAARKRQGYVALGIAGAGVLIALLVARSGVNDTTRPPMGNRCTVGSSGALSCGPTYPQPTYAQPTYLQPTYTWLENMPGLRPTGFPSRLLPTPSLVLPSDLLRELDIAPAPSR